MGSCEHARVVAENGSSREHDEGAGRPPDPQKLILKSFSTHSGWQWQSRGVQSQGRGGVHTSSAFNKQCPLSLLDVNLSTSLDRIKAGSSRSVPAWKGTPSNALGSCPYHPTGRSVSLTREQVPPHADRWQTAEGWLSRAKF